MIEPVADARPHRADAAARRGGARARGRPGATATGRPSPTPTSSSSTSSTIPGDQSSAAFLIAAGVLVKGSRLVLEDVGVNWTRTGFIRILERMGAIVLGELEPRGRVRPRRAGLRPRRLAKDRSRAPRSSPRRSRWRSTSCRWSRCSGASPRARRWSAAPASSGSRSRTGSRPWSRGCAGSAPRSRRLPDGFVGERAPDGLRGWSARRARRSPAGAARGGGRPRLDGGRRGRRDGGGRRLLPAGSPTTWRCSADDDRRDRRTRRRREVHRRARGRRGARLHVSRLRRDVPRGRAGGAAAVAPSRQRSLRRCGSSSGDRVLLDGEDVTDRDPDARGLRGRVARRRRSGRARGDGRRAAAAAVDGRLGRRGAGHRHRGRARRRRQGVPHRRSRANAPGGARPSSGSTPRRCWPSRRSATSATARASTRRSSRPPEPSSSTRPDSMFRGVVRRIVDLVARLPPS